MRPKLNSYFEALVCDRCGEAYSGYLGVEGDIWDIYEQGTIAVPYFCKCGGRCYSTVVTLAKDYFHEM